MTTVAKPRSEKSLDLLRQFLKLTEPGGCYGLPTPLTAAELDREDAQKREDFVNEVIGVLTSVVPGEVAPEHRIKTFELGLREIHTIVGKGLATSLSLALKDYIEGGDKEHHNNPAVVKLVSTLSDSLSSVAQFVQVLWHLTGEPLEKLKPVKKEELDVLDEVCNCEKCRQKRAAKKRG